MASKLADGDKLREIVKHHLISISDSSLDTLDVCSLALDVALVRDWTNYPRVVAIIHNVDSERNALFLFNGVRLAKDAYEDLKTTEIVALYKSFQCEPAKFSTSEEDSSVVNLRITGLRLTHLPKFLNRRPSFQVASKGGGDGHDDDESPRTLGKSGKVIGCGRARSTYKFRPCSFVLAFSNGAEADAFREQTASCAAVRLQNDFEVGQDVLARDDETSVTDTVANQYSWLVKYGSDTAHGSSDRNHDNDRLKPQLLLSNSSDDLSSAISSSPLSSGSHSSYSTTTHPKHTLSADEMVVDSSSAADNQLLTVHHYRSSSMLDQLDSNNNNNSAANFPKSPDKQQLNNNRLRPNLTASHSCSDISSKSYRHKNKTYLEDHMFRDRLSRADLFIREELLKRYDEYCTFETIRVYVGTWNVNGREDSNLRLDDWLRLPGHVPPADIYVFGFQELDLSLGSVALNKTYPAALEGRWTTQLESALDGLLASRGPKPRSSSSRSSANRTYAERWSKHTGGGYQRLRRVRLAGMLMVAYISRRLFRCANPCELDTQLVPTGVFNMMGNKGAVGLRLTLFNTGLCFINCHLAAGEANLIRRNQDFQEVKKKMLFDRRSAIGNLSSIEQLGLLDHDLVFVFGDLNYRTNGLDSSAVRQRIIQNEYDHILKYDELLKQLASHRTFGQFSECPITFAPTYKFDTNANIYDTSDKFRIPSYCDRILWYGKHCDPWLYRSHPTFVMSDHKPVSACFNVSLRRVNSQQFDHTYEAVIRSQDLLYNLSLPQAELDSQEFDFGPVRFYQVFQRTLTLTNTGRTGLQYQFMRDCIANIPSWLTITPETMRVEKDASIEINFEIFIKPEMVSELNSGVSELSSIVILRLIGGKDYFISVSGQFVPTSFGLPLSLLLQLDSIPIAWIPTDELRKKIKVARIGDWKDAEPSILTTTNTDQPPFHIPKELFRLIDFITKHMDTPELFRQSGQFVDVGIIRNMLDTTLPNVEFPDTVSVHGAVFCLLIFLNTLSESLIPPKFQSGCLAVCDNFPAAVKALTCLPIDHQNLFFYLVAFLRRCLSVKNKNGTDVQLLANTFGEVVFRDATRTTPPQPKTTQNMTSSFTRLENTTLFMTHFLTNDPSTYFAAGAIIVQP